MFIIVRNLLMFNLTLALVHKKIKNNIIGKSVILHSIVCLLHNVYTFRYSNILNTFLFCSCFVGSILVRFKLEIHCILANNS